MKDTIRFSKFFIPAAVISITILITGAAGFFTKGFALGVDFQPGLIQEVQFAPGAFSLKWSGTSNAILSHDRGNIHIVISGSGIENRTYTFPFIEYPTVGDLARALENQLEGMEANVLRPQASAQGLVFSSQGNPYLNNETPYLVHCLDPQSPVIDIADVRSALSGGFENNASVQSLGSPQDRHFMIRIVEDENTGSVISSRVVRLLEDRFGRGEVALLSSDYVGSRFSKDLTDQAGILLGLTLLLILIYASIRFKPQYAIGAVVAIVNDGIVIITFVIWTQMEFSTITIAAILTILGYSINNTIVIFDRIRENRKIFTEMKYIDILNKSLSGMLGRSIITTFTTILAVLFLFIFATGSMRNFALALMVGMVSGLYTTLFIAPGIVYLLEQVRNRHEKRKALAIRQGTL